MLKVTPGSNSGTASQTRNTNKEGKPIQGGVSRKKGRNGKMGGVRIVDDNAFVLGVTVRHEDNSNDHISRT